MKRIKLLIFSTLFCSSVGAMAQEEWRNPYVNQMNRAEPHADFYAYPSEKESQDDKSQASNYLSLDGMWRFNWVEHQSQRPRDFYKESFSDSAWVDFPVPGLWEMNGYGDPVYRNIGYAWSNFFGVNPPFIDTLHNHVGSYRREIELPAAWKKRHVRLHIGSATSNLYLWINGKFVGYSEDSKVAVEFDVTKYLRPGKNLIAMQIYRWCDGSYLEDQDFWRLSGIARDCYLYASPSTRMVDIEAIPDLDAQYADGTLDVEVTTTAKAKVEALLVSAEGDTLYADALPSVSSKLYKATIKVPQPQKWSAESPYLYSLQLVLRDLRGQILEVVPQQVGFRKVELKKELGQLWVNGQPVLIKGANRHEMDPLGGYVVSHERMEQDVRIMKEMNINAVRTCHYPDDPYWYQLCDRYGLYVVCEANLESHGTNYGDKTLAKNQAFAQAHLERNQRMVETYKNHPSIVIWSLGNEAGYGPNFEACYHWIKNRDHSRLVQYEQAFLAPCTDVVCPMYMDYGSMERYASDSSAYRPLIQCEYAHAMGNSQGGFKEYWDLIRRYPKLQGGFIWDFVDQALHRRTSDGSLEYTYGGDYNSYDVSDNNFNCNGLISPDRKLNPHAYEVKYFYQDIQTTPVDVNKGKIRVYNEHFFVSLSDYYMEWNITADGQIVKSGFVPTLDVAPQSAQEVQLDYDVAQLPTDAELLLNISYKLKEKKGLLEATTELAYCQLPIHERIVLPKYISGDKKAEIQHKDSLYVVKGEDFAYTFNAKTGLLEKINILGVDYLKSGSALRPNFWRAPTDNDMGANLQKHYALWQHPEMNLRAFKVVPSSAEAAFEATYSLPELAAELHLQYRVNGDGQIAVTQSMVVDTVRTDMPPLFRFGLRMEMPQMFDRVDYYGRGPVENYADRKCSQPIGRYRQSVAEQFHPYIRPQETGTKSDLRTYAVLDIDGRGLQFSADTLFSASALPYTQESLCPWMEKRQYHATDLPEQHLTAVCVDARQMGLGCINSWGATPLPSYMLPYRNYQFQLLITPIRH